MFNRIISNLTGGDKAGSNDSKNELERAGVFIKKLDEIPEIFAEKINEIILKEEFYKIASFAGGEFIIEYIDDKSYSLCYHLYFQDQKDATYEVNSKKQQNNMSRLSDEAQKDLKRQKTVKYDIPEPSEEFRKKYKLVKI